MTEHEFQVETGLITEHCITCGTYYAFPKELQRLRLKDRKLFYCPNGQPQCYAGKTKEAKLKEKLVEAETCCNIYKNRERRREYQKRYYKGELTKLKKGSLNEQPTNQR